MEGFFYGRKVPRRPAAGPRERTAGGSWSPAGSSPRGSRSACATSSFLSEQQLNDETAADLQGVIGAYPEVQLRFTPDLVWLLNYIKPIRGLEDAALVVTAYPRNQRDILRSWAWWGPGFIWIGPRHTNYPDGSICSFEPCDGTWRGGQPLQELLDLHAVWIVRHLFLRRFGRWPGRQVFHTAYERLTEHRPNELCGGCNSRRRYEECCREVDEKTDPIGRAVLFTIQFRGASERRPPRPVAEFIYGARNTPPSLSELASSSSDRLMP